jgi:MSHA biogenesis protein MshN
VDAPAALQDRLLIDPDAKVQPMSVLNTMLRDLERRGERPAQPLTAPSPAWTSPSIGAATAVPQTRARTRTVRPALWLSAAAAAALAFWLWPRPAPVPARLDQHAAGHLVAAPVPATEPPAGATAPAALPAPSAQPLPPAANVAQVAPIAPAPQAEPSAQRPQTAPPPALQLAAAQPSRPPPAAVRPHPAPAARDAEPAAPAVAAAAPAAPSVAQSAKQSELAHATDLIGRGRANEAAQLLAEALARRPDWNEARATLAALQAESGDRRLAMATLLDGAAIDPRRFAPTAAQLQAELDDPAAALQTLEKVPPDARDLAYHALAAAVAQRAGRHQLAVVEYGAALRFAPTDAVAWVGLGISLQALGRDAEALAAYRGATREMLSAELRGFVDSRIRALQVTVAPPAP